MICSDWNHCRQMHWSFLQQLLNVTCIDTRGHMFHHLKSVASISLSSSISLSGIGPWVLESSWKGEPALVGKSHYVTLANLPDPDWSKNRTDIVFRVGIQHTAQLLSVIRFYWSAMEQLLQNWAAVLSYCYNEIKSQTCSSTTDV